MPTTFVETHHLLSGLQTSPIKVHIKPIYIVIQYTTVIEQLHDTHMPQSAV